MVAVREAAAGEEVRDLGLELHAELGVEHVDCRGGVLAAAPEVQRLRVGGQRCLRGRLASSAAVDALVEAFLEEEHLGGERIGLCGRGRRSTWEGEDKIVWWPGGEGEVERIRFWEKD